MADAKPAAGGGRAGLSEPEPGQTFLQVVATGERDAETIADTASAQAVPLAARRLARRTWCGCWWGR